MKCLLLGFGAVMLSLFLSPPMVAAQDADNFTINNFDVTYHITRDQEGRSILKTTEKITATFPQIDKNHGLERSLPTVYDGHEVRLVIDSVTDETGSELAYRAYPSNDNTVLRIGDADSYVHGAKTYIITYTQHDVTRYFKDTDDDELYWDVSGTGWAQTIESVHAHVVIDPTLRSSLTGKNACYQGRGGQNEPCLIGGSGLTSLDFRASKPLRPSETMTFAIGFQPGTFSGYQETWQEKFFAVIFIIWIVTLIVGSIASIAAVIWMFIYRSKIMNRTGSGQTIPTQYIPPKDMSILGAAQIINARTSAVTAQLLDLAVRHHLKIYQTKDKKIFQPAEYELELTGDISLLRQEEKRLLTDLFGKHPAVGDRFAMKKLRGDYVMTARIVKSKTWLRSLLRGNYGIYERAKPEARHLTKAATIFMVVGVVTLSPLMIVVAIVGYWSAVTLWPETEKGADIHDYLEGLRRYITLAEADRIELLQSPDGVEKGGAIAADKGQIIKLYERLLGYAVLFGVEKEWMKQLGTYYEQSSMQPDWYAGNTAFNAVMFSSAISSFSDQMSSYSSPSSSSTGGSDGGGFSGGGGGGGGGGGW